MADAFLIRHALTAETAVVIAAPDMVFKLITVHTHTAVGTLRPAGRYIVARHYADIRAILIILTFIAYFIGQVLGAGRAVAIV